MIIPTGTPTTSASASSGGKGGKLVYPSRPKFFAHRVVRLAMKTCLAQEIGPNATLLVIYVAHTEDAKHYRAPPTFFTEQLLPILGIRKWESLDRARKAAEAAGWLHYEAPPSGMRRAGTYWTLVPDRYSGLDDQPSDEHSDHIRQSDTVEGLPYPSNGYGEGDGRGYGKGYGRGYGRGELSIPVPDPIPDPKSVSARADARTPQKLAELILGWNALGPEIVKPGNGARENPPSKAILAGWNKSQREPDLRQAFADIPALLTAIRGARYCHRGDWFTVEWLFGKNQDKVWKAVKLMNGGYDNARGTNGNPRPRYDPVAAGRCGE